MMTVAVEQGLGSVKQYLESQGCRCVDVENEESTVNSATVMVVTGADRNVMGIQDVVNEIPVISAEGLTPEEVFKRVKTYLH